MALRNWVTSDMRPIIQNLFTTGSLRVNNTPRRVSARFAFHYERARFGDSAEDAERLPELYREMETVSKE